MAHPNSYKTLAGLLKATEKMLSDHHQGHRVKFDGLSRGMWLQNATFVADSTFGDSSGIATLQRKWSCSRPQDLQGGHSLFGVALPQRDYITGDNVPGVGLIQEIHGEQMRVNGQWYHKRCFETETASPR